MVLKLLSNIKNFSPAIAFELLVMDRDGFSLNEKIRNLVECFNQDLSKPELVPRLNTNVIPYCISACGYKLFRQLK